MIAISPLGIKKSNRQTIVNKTLHRNQKTEQHEYQTQERGIVYRQTHRATCTANTRGGALCTDRLTEQHVQGIVYRQTHRATCTGDGHCVQTDSQGRGTPNPGECTEQTHRGGVVCTDRLTEQHTKPRGGALCTDRFTEQHEYQTQGRGIVYR